MNIAFVYQDLFTQGVQYVISQLAFGMVAAGEDVYVILSKVHSDLSESSTDKPYPLPPEAKVEILPFRNARKNGSALAALCEREKIDVLLLHSSSYIVPSVCALKQCPWLKIVFVEHVSKRFRKKPESLRVFLRRVVRSVYEFHLRNLLKRHCQLFIGVTDNVRAELVEAGFPLDKTVTVYNPIEVKANVPSDFVPHAWLQRKAMPVIVTAGAFSECKRLPNIVEAFNLIRGRGMACRLIIFGSPSDGTQELMEAIEKSPYKTDISLPGFTFSLVNEFRLADVFAMASRYETFSIVTLQAIYAGLPVVVPMTAGGVAEVASKFKGSCIVKDNEPESVANGIEGFLKGGARSSSEDKQENKEKIDEMCGSDRVALRYLESIRKL